MPNNIGKNSEKYPQLERETKKTKVFNTIIKITEGKYQNAVDPQFERRIYLAQSLDIARDTNSKKKTATIIMHVLALMRTPN